MILLRKLAVLLIILLGIIVFLISPIGLNTTLYLASHFIPGKFTYQSVSGNLTKSLTLVKLEYKNNFVDIKSDYLRITWHPRKLIHRELAIDSIHAHNLTVEIYQKQKGQKSKSTQATTSSLSKTPIKFSPLDFSWTITINHSMVSNLKLKYDAIQKTVNVPLINLQGVLNRDKTNLQLFVNQNIDNQPSGSATLKGSIQNYTLDADYKNILKKQYYTLYAAGDQTHLTAKINTQSYQAKTLNIHGEALLSWNNQLTWSSHLQVEGLPLSIPSLYPLSRAKFNLAIEGLFDGSSLKQTITFSNMTFWLVNGTSFNGHAQFNQKNNLLTLIIAFQNDNDYLTLNASLNHDLNLTWKLHADELSDLLMNLNGSITSDGTITKQSNKSNIQAYLNLSDSNIGDLNIEEINVKVNGTLDKHNISVNGSIQQAKISGQLVGKAEINPWTWSGTLNQLTVYSPNLGSWKLSKSASLFFSTEQMKINSLHFVSEKNDQLLIDALWSQVKRTLEGKLEFNMDKLSLPFLNITLTQLKANGSANGESANLTVSALSQGSPIKLKGSATWQKALQLKANLSGNNILIVDTSEYKATASPDLTLQIQQNRRIDLTGDITIPKATITPDSFISVVTLPSDVEFVGIAEKKPSLFKLYTNINLILGDNISINTQGIKGKLQGHLAIIKSPDQPFVGNGTLSIANASYNIFGQTLTITKGHLNFVNSTLANPNLNIQASRSFATSLSSSSFGVERLTVGANLSGTLKQPQISLFSQPVQLSDVDILSYLLFGSSAGSAGGGNVGGGPAANALILLQIANSLKSGKNTGDTSLIQKLQSGLRLTELGVQTQTNIDAVGNIVSSNEQVVAGAYLSPKLYFRYRYDLFDEENIFEAQYLLSKSWIAQTNTSASGEGADILYTIERGN